MVEQLWNLKILRVPLFFQKELTKSGNRRKRVLTGVLPSSESKAIVGCYEYHFLIKEIFFSGRNGTCRIFCV